VVTQLVLTSRQLQILLGIGRGMRNREIAAQLRISETAVKATVQQLFRKFVVRRRVQLVQIAFASEQEQARSDATSSFPLPTSVVSDGVARPSRRTEPWE
jgi:DNA-binding CsgD family transcriptional regulator